MENYENKFIFGDKEQKIIEKINFNQGETIIIPEGVTKINNFYFYFNRGIVKKIIFPSTLKSISRGAFQNLTHLEEVIINEGLELIGPEAFYNTNIHKIYLPKSIKIISKNAFSTNQQVKELHIYCEDEPTIDWIDKDVVEKIYRSVPNPDSEGFNFHRSSGGFDCINVEVGEETVHHTWYFGNVKIHTHVSYEEYKKL